MKNPSFLVEYNVKDPSSIFPGCGIINFEEDFKLVFTGSSFRFILNIGTIFELPCDKLPVNSFTIRVVKNLET